MSKYFIDTEFWERPGKIDLISIGIVSEDGRRFYAVNTEFDWEQCDLEWLHLNVKANLNGPRNTFYGGSDIIRKAILEFIGNDKSPEFWGWFSDYDWVVFCMIFGSMVDLPKGWPMFCRDLMQRMIDVGVPRAQLPQMSGKDHNALDDAIWTKQAWDFVETIRRGP